MGDTKRSEYGHEKNMKIIIENTVCSNTGDAAILFAIRSIIKHSIKDPIDFVVFDSQPEVVTKLYNDAAYSDISFRKLISESIFTYKRYKNPIENFILKCKKIFLKAVLRYYRDLEIFCRYIFDNDVVIDIEQYKSADLLITTGGTYLVEEYNMEKRIDQFYIDMYLGKMPIFFTQSLGPFRIQYNKKKLGEIFNRSPLILLRDEASKGHILNLVDDSSKCHVVADAVFALADTARVSKLLKGEVSCVSSGRVAISVRRWKHVRGGKGGMDRYIEAVQELTRLVVRDYGKAVTFVSTCQGVPEYHHDDSELAKMIVAGLDPDIARHVTVDRDFRTPDQLMAFMKDFEFVIATRMHMMIMSLCVGTPVLPIAYEFKTIELSKRIGVLDILLDIDTISAEKARAKLQIFMRDFDHYRISNLEATLEEHASAMSTVDLIEPLLKGGFNEKRP